MVEMSIPTDPSLLVSDLGEHVRRLRLERGLTMIMVSHNLAVIAYMCDRLAVMNRGEVVETLDAAQLRRHQFSHPYTQQLFRASAGYDRSLLSEALEAVS